MNALAYDLDRTLDPKQAKAESFFGQFFAARWARSVSDLASGHGCLLKFCLFHGEEVSGDRRCGGTEASRLRLQDFTIQQRSGLRSCSTKRKNTGCHEFQPKNR